MISWKMEFNIMSTWDIKQRMILFLLKVIQFCDELPKSLAADVVKNQLLSYCTSISLSYCNANGSITKADLLANMESIQKCIYHFEFWTDFTKEANLIEKSVLDKLTKEVNEIYDIICEQIDDIKRN